MKVVVRAYISRIDFYDEISYLHRREVLITSNIKLSVFSKLLQECKILAIEGSGFLSLEMPDINYKIFLMLGEIDIRGRKELKKYLLEFLNDKICKDKLIEILTPYLIANKLGRKEKK